ncbi:MAG: DUF3429 domain-containing protein [Dinoroseobacter sp.]|nr:DUF3429 domain-containing protein [Dinoroseobacter sp.]
MSQIPRAALILGLAGLIPFLFGTATLFSASLAQWGLEIFGARFIGPYVQIFYGTIILSFMSGVIWGFATKATGTVAASGYALSVVPALWAFFMVGGGARSASLSLAVGFIGLIAIDYIFWKQQLAPPWWMHLRILLTTVVVICLFLTANA